MEVRGRNGEVYEVIIVSPPQFDDVVAEILGEGGTLCYLYERRQGSTTLLVQLVPRSDGKCWEVEYETLHSLLRAASERLKAMGEPRK